MYSSPLKRKRDDPSGGGQPISRESALPYAPRESQLSKYLAVIDNWILKMIFGKLFMDNIRYYSTS